MRHETQEIGGYIGFEKYSAERLHEGAIALNSGRHCLAYVIRAKKIRAICLPYFLCSSVRAICEQEHVVVRHYSIDQAFFPEKVKLQEDEWLYLVNYYGQICNAEIRRLSRLYKRIIVDAAQAYFQFPAGGNISTLYSCRKFFGVPDGGLLYTDTFYNVCLKQDYSYEKMHYLLGSFEKPRSEFYREYIKNNQSFVFMTILRMSRLTDNLLRAVSYEEIKKRRTDNFRILDNAFHRDNILNLKLAEGAYMYPLWISQGQAIRKELIARKIYIPVLWPDVFQLCGENTLEYKMAQNILPLPVDQRYGEKEMEYLIRVIQELLKFS